MLLIWICVILGTAAQEIVHNLEERLSFSIREGLPAGTLVGKIRRKPGFSYRLQERNRFFDYDDRTAEIRSTSVIDREAISSDHSTLIILSSEPTYLISVNIDVIDVNDNPPLFPFTFQNVTISENAQVGFDIPLWTATDADSGQNGAVDIYRLIGGNHERKFQLLYDQTGSELGSLRLRLLTPLDRETTSHYVLNITAQDSGTPPLSGYLAVFVTVIDANDNAPEFNQSDYAINLPENEALSSILFTANATDRDAGQNAKFRYQIEPSADSPDIVSINPGSGEVTLVGSPSQCPLPKSCQDCERSCVFTLSAVDEGTPAQVGRAFLHLKVTDVNDHAPAILFRYHADGAEFAVVEQSMEPGGVVTVVTTSDEDQGANGNVTLRIIDGNQNGYFSLDTNSVFGLVRLQKSLKYSRKRVFNLTFEAVDAGFPPLRSKSSLLIYVKNERMTSPEFEHTSYSASVPEGSEIGAFVTTVAVKPAKQRRPVPGFPTDQTPTAVFKFVELNDSRLFHIGESSGVVTVAGDLDYETRPRITLTVSVHWSHLSVLSTTTATLTVTIEDQNDNAPVFGESSIKIEVKEDVRPGTLLRKISASDVDTGDGGRVSYRIAQNSPHLAKTAFAIDASSGAISLQRSLDREVTPSYNFEVEAYDHGVPTLASTIPVEVVILDVNDHRPVLYPVESWVTLLSSSPQGTEIFKAKATDPDTGEYGRVAYVVLQSPVSSVEIDRYEGTLRLKRIPFGRTTMDVVVGAEDGGGLQSQVNTTVHVTFVSSFETLPKFKKFPTGAITITEGAITNQAVATITATDSESQSQVVYHITDGDPDGDFEIGLFSGDLRAIRPIDRERTAEYGLEITAVGKYGSTAAALPVHIADENDNSPQFPGNLSHIDVFISSDWPTGYPARHIEAIDPDAGENGELIYELDACQDNYVDFGIDPRTGILRLQKPASYVNVKKCENKVVVADRGRPQRATTIGLTIHQSKNTTKDVLGPEPVINLFVRENSPPFEKLRKITSSKISADPLDEQKVIRIAPDGWVYLQQSLDYETTQFHTGLFRVTFPEVIDAYLVEVNVYVINVNDNRPQCASSELYAQVNENEAPLTWVTQVPVQDADGEGRLTYSIISGADFLVDRSSGMLMTGVMFDREEIVRKSGSANLSVVVQACDPQLMSECASCRVIVEIQDVNDHHPVFTKRSYQISIPENQLPMSSVGKVTATDKDAGHNSELTYSIPGYNPHFEIDPLHGHIRMLNQTLDREDEPFHVFDVQACDHGIPAKCTTVPVVVDLVDVNDNPPRGINNPGYVNISETAPLGTIVTTFHAYDPDEGKNGEFHFSIETGNMGHSFAINPITGDLVVQKQLDYSQRPLYTLTVIATDHGNPPQRSTFPIVIHVRDENNRTPVIHTSSLTGRVSENAPQGTLALSVNATDSDSGEAGDLRYYIVEQSPFAAFQIDHYTGEVRTTKPIDREDAETFELEIEVADSPLSAAVRHRVRKIANILVSDVNDNTPSLFGAKATTVSVLSTSGHKITQFDGSDRDVGINSTIGYRMISGSDYFGIGVDGSVYLRTQVPRHSVEPLYELRVEMFDRFNPQLSYNPVTYIASLRSTFNLTVIMDPETRSPHMEFSRPDFLYEIYENATVGSSIGRLTMTNDFVAGHLAFYITKIQSAGKNIHEAISIDKHSATLAVAGGLGDIIGNGIDLTVVAVDLAKIRIAQCKVKIKIIDVNNSPPVLKPPIRRVLVSEGAGVGTPVFALSAFDADTQGRLAYTFANLSSPFLLHPTTGVVTLKQALDREAVPEYRLSYDVNDGIHTMTGKVVVTVTDVNDNVPTFNRHAYFLTVWSGAAYGTFVGAVYAKDLDEGRNATVSYHLRGTSDSFHLDSATGILSVKADLHGSEENQLVEVEAVDAGHSPMSATVQVFIRVHDRYRPKLQRSHYSLSIPENATIKTPILDIAFERTYPAPIRFKISNDYEKRFSINTKGQFILEKPLDREMDAKYSLTVEAYYDVHRLDSNKFGPTKCEILISVVDVNDNAPEFIGVMSGSVPENSPAGTTVGILTATDVDEGINSKVVFGLGIDHQDKFYVDPVTGAVSTTTSLDYEENSKYNLSVFVADYGSPQLRTEGHFVVHVIDLDDNIPTFVQRSFEADVVEGTLPGTTVLNLRVVDIDTAGNGAMQFDIQDEELSAVFSISPQTGDLLLMRKLPAGRDHLNFSVTVSNTGQEQQPSVAEVAIRVKKMNLHSPVFPLENVTFELYENLVSGLPAVIGRIKAIDLDSGVNAKLSYSIIQGNTSVFTVDAVSGELFAAMGVDRELQDTYELTIIATDSGLPRLTGTCRVTVRILDMNDNYPVFRQPYYILDIGEDAPVGTSVGDIIAHDADIGANGEIRYRVSNNKHFAINPVSGVLSVTTPVDRETVASHKLIITASDQGPVRPLSTTIEVMVNVLDVNDNAPVITFPTGNDVLVQDQADSGDEVFVVGVQDQDIGENSEITFTIVQGSSDFKIDHDGVVRVVRPLRFGEDYPVTILAKDNGGTNSFNDTRSYIVKVKSSENFPVCSSGNKNNITVSEGKASELVGQVTARSSKQPPFNRISFSIVSGNSQGAFEIDANSGKLWTTKNVDREAAPEARLWIAAKDNDNPALVSYCSVGIRVTDVNDNPPKFDRAVYAAKVSENLPAGQPVVQVEATDRDEGVNARCTYELIDGNSDGSFTIDANTGEISTTVSLDRELLSQYHLRVEATDGGTPALATTCDVIVDVLDINDNAPKFTRLLLTKISEKAPVGSSVIAVRATDLDSIENSNNTYYFSKNPGGYFSIDAYTGNVTLVKPLDREMIAEHHLKVIATDDVWRIQTSLTVIVSDVNDNPPRFHGNYVFNLTESDAGRGLLGVVNATDVDEVGPNSDIVYSLSGYNSNYFHIDSSTGEISHVRPLKCRRYTHSTFELTVTARDLGMPSLWSTTDVVVNVFKANRFRPQFEQNSFTVPILNEPPVGSVVFRALATDEDGPVVYSMGNDLFRIDPITGVVTTNRPETISPNTTITVIAADLQYPTAAATAKVAFEPAKSLIPSVESVTNVSVAASQTVGVVFHELSAGIHNLHFELGKSRHSEYFVIRPNGGVALVRDLRALETDNVHFSVIVGFRGLQPESNVVSTLNIQITGFLRFRKAELEYFPACKAVRWVPALNDQLVGCDRPTFSLKNTTYHKFQIDRETGVIKSNQPTLRRETIVTEIAATCEEQQRSVPVTIHLPHCEYQPFSKHHYDLTVPLILEEKSVVGTVNGPVGADITYYLDAQSTAQGFGVQDGAIYAARRMNSLPDRFNMTVFAAPKNALPVDVQRIARASVTLKLSPQAKVSKLPAFRANLFKVSVSPNTAIGAVIFDMESALQDPVNNTWGFFIQPRPSFLDINPETGKVALSSKEFGYQEEAQYLIGVRDTVGRRMTSALVIDAEAAEKPFVASENRIGVVSENRQVGTNVMALYPVGGDIRMRLKDDAGAFALDSAGVLKTTKLLDREEQQFYYPVISLGNLGSKKSEDVTLTVQVSDQNDNPSVSTSFTVYISILDAVPQGKIPVTIHPRDPDATGKYTCRLMHSVTPAIEFRDDCSALVSPSKMTSSATMTVSGGDGVHSVVDYKSYVKLQRANSRDIERSIQLVVRPEHFYLAGVLFDSLTSTKLLKASKVLGFDDRSFSVFIYSTPEQSHPDALLSDINSVLSTTPIRVTDVLLNPCDPSPCKNNGECKTVASVSQPFTTFDTNVSDVWVLPRVHRSYQCVCRQDFSGQNCDQQVHHCAVNPCYNGGNCTAKDGRATCECPPGFSGDHCQDDINECARNPCQNGGYCENLPGSYRCICLVGFTGKNCDNQVDECSNMPCHNGGTCVKSDGEYVCKCTFGYSGQHCEHSSVGLDFASYLKLPPLNPKSNELAIEFATVESRALLLISYDERSSVSQDFIAVDIIDGRVRLSGRLGNEDLDSVVLNVVVNDGNWHRLDLKQESEIVIMSVSECRTAENSCRQCVWGDANCHASINTGISSLPVSGHSMFLGSVQHFTDLLHRPGRLAHFGFKGCIRSMRINQHGLATIVRTTAVQKVLPGCQRRESSGSQCGTGCGDGKCIDRWDYSSCSCSGGFTAIKCSDASKPLSLSKGAHIELRPTTVHKKSLQFKPVALDDVFNIRFQRSTVDRPASFDHNVRLRFRTNQRNAALLLAVKEDNPQHFVAVNIVNGTVQFATMSLKSRHVFVTLDKMGNTGDGSFHELILAYSSSERKAEIQIDDYGKAIKFNDPVPELFTPTTVVKIGSAAGTGGNLGQQPGFDGCVSSLIIDGELQNVWNPSNKSTFEITLVAGPSYVKKECDRGGRCDEPPCPVVFPATDVLHPGIISLITFFIALIIIAFVVFLVYHMRKSTKKSTASSKSLAVVCGNDFSATAESRLTSLGSWASGQKSNNNPIYATPSNQVTHVPLRPTVVPHRANPRHSNSLDMLSPVSYFGGAYSNRIDATADEDPERYDLDNASSIAPSDVDVAYHYRSYGATPGRDLFSQYPHSDNRYPPSNSGTASIGRSRRPRRQKEGKSGSPASSLHSTSRNGSQHRKRQARGHSKSRGMTSADILSSPQNIIDSSSSSDAAAQRRRAPPSRSSSRRANGSRQAARRDSSTELPSSDDERAPRSHPIRSLMQASHTSLGGSPWDRIPPRPTVPPHAAPIQMTTDDETDFHEDTVPDLSSFVNRSGELNNLFIGRALSSSNETLSRETRH